MIPQNEKSQDPSFFIITNSSLYTVSSVYRELRFIMTGFQSGPAKSGR